jgi:hypothetical protein
MDSPRANLSYCNQAARKTALSALGEVSMFDVVYYGAAALGLGLYAGVMALALAF